MLVFFCIDSIAVSNYLKFWLVSIERDFLFHKDENFKGKRIEYICAHNRMAFRHDEELVESIREAAILNRQLEDSVDEVLCLSKDDKKSVMRLFYCRTRRLVDKLMTED